jgi:hypothetical protein
VVELQTTDLVERILLQCSLLLFHDNWSKKGKSAISTQSIIHFFEDYTSETIMALPITGQLV